MKVTNLMVLSLLSLLIGSCHNNSKNVSSPSDTVKKVVKTPRFIRGISIVALIANPEKYEGDTVMVAGFLNLEFEGNALYIHKDDYEHRIFKNSIWVDVDRDSLKSYFNKYNQKYVMVQGVFYRDQGGFGSFSGSVKTISNIYIQPSGAPRPPKEKKDKVFFPPPSRKH